MDTTFRVRYQATQSNGTGAALLVEDRCGSLYLFSDGQLQLRFDRESWSERVDTILERAQSPWLPVEGDTRLPLAALPTYAASVRRAQSQTTS
jgi:hypothetical protein